MQCTIFPSKIVMRKGFSKARHIHAKTVDNYGVIFQAERKNLIRAKINSSFQNNKQTVVFKPLLKESGWRVHRKNTNIKINSAKYCLKTGIQLEQ